jgi:hypothetical protein
MKEGVLSVGKEQDVSLSSFSRHHDPYFNEQQYIFFILTLPSPVISNV